jgi:tetratricopeptide (TPR) repeat protein
MEESALEFHRRVLPPDHPHIGMSMSNLANKYGDLGRHEDALTMKKSVLEFHRRVLPPDHPHIGDSMNSLAVTYSDLGRHEDALTMEESALEFRRRIFSPDHPDIAVSLHNISLSYEGAGDMRRATDCAREAVRIWKAALPPGHPHLNLAEKNVLRLERKNKRQRGDGARTHGVPPTSSRRRRSPASSPLWRQAHLSAKHSKQVAHVFPPAALARNCNAREIDLLVRVELSAFVYSRLRRRETRGFSARNFNSHTFFTLP